MSDSIEFRATNLLEWRGITNETTDAPISAPTSVTGKLYDDRKDVFVQDRVDRLSIAAAAAATALTLDSTARFANSDAVQIELDDGTLFSTTISTVDTATTLTLAAGITTAAAAGRPIRRLVHPIGATVIEVSNGLLFELSDTVEVRQDDGTFFASTVSQRHHDYVTLAAGITVAVSTGARLAHKLGGDISMTLYGTPVADDESWGFRGTIAATHAGLKVGQRVRGETELIDTGGQVYREEVRLIVVGDG